MTEQREGGIAHPYRTLVPVLPLELVLTETGALAESANLLRSRDAIGPYMYLPPLPGVLDEEGVACLFRPALVSDQLLAEPPRRVAQLQPEVRRHLKIKLAAYWGRAGRGATATVGPFLSTAGRLVSASLRQPTSPEAPKSRYRLKAGND